MKTFSLRKEDVKKKWLLIDAKDAVLGRLAVHSANILRGNNKPNYTPNQDCGDNLVIINADHVHLTGKKASDKALENVAKKLRVNNVQELYARLGSAELQPRDIINVIFPDFSTTKGPEIDQKLAVIGLAEGQSFNRRPCFQPLPGERIVGIATTGKGVSVHSIDCPTLVSFEDNMDLWLDFHWHAGKHPSVYPITLELTISNDAGVLGRVCTIVGDLGANISDMEFLDRKLDFFKLILTIDLRDVEHLHAILSRLDGEHAVATVSRTRRIGSQSD